MKEETKNFMFGTKYAKKQYGEKIKKLYKKFIELEEESKKLSQRFSYLSIDFNRFMHKKSTWEKMAQALFKELLNDDKWLKNLIKGGKK